MQEIWEKIKENWGKLLVGLILVGILFGIFLFYQQKVLQLDLSFLGKDELELRSLRSEITRNQAWLFWIPISGFGLCLGLCLAWWGRQIQQKQWETQENSALHERYTESAAMLGNELMAVRVAGCRSLADLAIYNKNMTSLCARSLLSYINEPLLGNDENPMQSETPLREDIQVAANSVSEIYKHAYKQKDTKNNEIISLPEYFLLNGKKEPICLAGGNLIGQNMQKASLFGANLESANLSGANLRDADLSEIDLQSADLIRTDAQNANLSLANLKDAKLGYAILENANLSDANLEQATLLNTILKNANLSDVNLKQAILSDAELKDANLSGANLEQATLLNAVLKNADLSDVNLEQAILSDAKLKDANLSGINFKGANLAGADITGTLVTNAKHLTKEQVLSAKWGTDEKGKGEPPVLDDKLMHNEAIKEWCKNPGYKEGSYADAEERSASYTKKDSGIISPNQKLSEIIHIETPYLYKTHCGVRNPQGIEPLRVFADGYWDDWQLPWGRVSRFNREYIFTMMRFFPEPNEDTWIFGGIYKTINRKGPNDYDVELTDQGEKYIGRLKFKLKLSGRSLYRRLETVYDDMEVVEMLPENYIIDTFKTR